MNKNAFSASAGIPKIYDLGDEDVPSGTNFLKVMNYDGHFDQKTGKNFLEQMQLFAQEHGENIMAYTVSGLEEEVVMTAQEPGVMIDKIASSHSGYLTSSFMDRDNFLKYRDGKKRFVATETIEDGLDHMLPN